MSIDKDLAREKFLKENPLHKALSEKEYRRRVAREKILKVRLQRLEEIFELRYANKMKLVAIGEKFGISKQRVHQIITKQKNEYHKKTTRRVV